jgi:hypothetical protein
MAFCQQCGQPLEAGARFCEHCGASNEAAAPAGAAASPTPAGPSPHATATNCNVATVHNAATFTTATGEQAAAVHESGQTITLK